MRYSIIITTRNRCEDLKRTLLQLQRMNPAPQEIIVTADGCDDDTIRMVQQDFPQCRLIMNPSPLGSVQSRDHMLRSAFGDWVLSLDDDSYPLDHDFFQKIKPLIEAHPEVSVFSFPELLDHNKYFSRLKLPDSKPHYANAYSNCAAMMKREDYLRTSGFPHFFFHAYEEPDYSVQVYQLGKAVWFEPTLIFRHHFSLTNRDMLKTHHYNARNELWSVWMRCPLLLLIPVSLFRIFKQFLYAWSENIRWVIKEPIWWINALKGFKRCIANRRPLSPGLYLQWMRLARNPVYNKLDWERLFNIKN